MPMPKPVGRTNLYDKIVQLEVCRTFSAGVWVWISQLTYACMFVCLFVCVVCLLVLSVWLISSVSIYVFVCFCRRCLFCRWTPRVSYTRSPLQDSRLFGTSPWKILATTYLKKTIPEQPSPWRKSCKRESCFGDRGYQCEARWRRVQPLRTVAACLDASCARNLANIQMR